ncbi:Protein CBG01295 [Caenorhabditis briggsae]|uniref:Protein CBG01295 n=1 Tax=Caenorhabditis briggsae TaxID=6238 RepID=A8WQ26_CAEBR|nr:Protein CBG01295 [Caenorhabditis briggsae]CAP22584.2 Protein CBG01295 [Caenorhabditis briggsae]
MPPMYLSGKLFTLATILFSLISVLIYSSILLSIFWLKTIEKVPELSLFYCFFIYDILCSFASELIRKRTNWKKVISVFLNVLIMFLSTTDAVQFFIDNRNFAFYIVYPVYLLGSMRALLLLIIELDRTFAVYFPLSFFKYRNFIPTTFLVGITIIYAFFDISAMFIYCGDSIDVPPGCISIMCALSICYRNYWLSYEKVTYALNIALSGLLSVKLFVMRHKQDRNEELKKVSLLANRLVLIDFCILIIFDITPPLIVSYFPGFYPYMGPVNAFFKTVGFVIEGCLVYINLNKRSEKPKTVNVVPLSTTILIYSGLILSIFWLKSIKRVSELSLFYCFFVYNILCSFPIGIPFIYALFDLSVMFIFCGDFIDVPPGCVSVMCAFSLCYKSYWLTFEKTLYAMNIALSVGITLTYALFDLSTMFIICGDSIDVPPGCISILCAMSTSYITYFMTYEKVTYALNIALTGFLSIKLFVMRHKQDKNAELKRVNRLVLIDFCIIIMFDISLPLIFLWYPGYWPYTGSVKAFFKTTGFVIKGCLVYLNLKQMSEKSKKSISVSVVPLSKISVSKSSSFL